MQMKSAAKLQKRDETSEKLMKSLKKQVWKLKKGHEEHKIAWKAWNSDKKADEKHE